MTPLTLASTSRVRRALLSAAGLAFDSIGPDVDEDALKRGRLGRAEEPGELAARLADAKALAVARERPGLVIGADQTLEFDGALYDKVADLGAARERLKMLGGRPHFLHAAVTVAEGQTIVWRDLVTTRLTMRAFSDAFLDAYLAGNAATVLSSVGCYELEGEGVQLFERIEGDYFAILGLPLLGLLAFLRTRGVVAT
jgi:septum formation protein